MRYIFLNNALLTPASMPDPDARNSFFESCTLTGNFAGYDFRNASFSNCTLVGNFSGMQHEYMTSWQSNWTGATLPSNIGTFKHDLVVAVLRQRLSQLSAARRTKMQNYTNFLLQDYSRSWTDGAYRLINTEGLTVAQIRTIYNTLCAGFPNLLQRANDVLDGKEGAFTATPKFVRPATQPLMIGDTRIDLLTDPRMVGEDRWAIERTLEIPGWLVHIYTLHPWPYARSINLDTYGGTPDFGWWGNPAGQF